MEATLGTGGVDRDRAARRLRLVKLAHTAVWAFFAGCVLWVPLLAWRREYHRAFVVIGIILVEVAVLAVNRVTCPLTNLAARYTDHRRPNFDIYLPVWLARHNKAIFGSLFVVGIAVTLAQWRGWAS